MEDSYTVHRRRKNEAAKRRDKASLENLSKPSNKDDNIIDDKPANEEKQVEELLLTDSNDSNYCRVERKKSSTPPTSKPLLPQPPASDKEVTLSTSDGLDTTVKNKTEVKRGESNTSETENLQDTNILNNNDKNCLASTPITTTTEDDGNKNKKQSSKRQKSKRTTNDDPEIIDNRKSREYSKEYRSPSISSKRIIPLMDNSDLMKDLQRIQEIEYDRKRFSSIIDDDDDNNDHDDEVSVKKPLTRKKNHSKVHQRQIIRAQTPAIINDENCGKEKFWNWLSILLRFKKSPTDDNVSTATIPPENEKWKIIKSRFSNLNKIREEFKYFKIENSRELDKIRKHRNQCIVELIFILIYCGLGACIFRFTEGAFETFYKCGVKRIKRDFLDSLWNYSHNMREEEWKSMARRKLMEFEEQLHTAHEAGLFSYSGQKSWTFLNAILYCFTVISKIGYGHISPSTTTGRAITILYAIFGIPMFLIILADFGKLFTRGIKFLWAFVRRLYYTGSCRRVRRRAQVQEMIKGVQLVYDFATFRRPSQMNPDELEQVRKQTANLTVNNNIPGSPAHLTDPGTPATPTMSAFEIDDEFNLPISVAITILLVYIFVGATAYNIWERWGFFESFYFVFISMSTIGFGDYVPKHPIYMMCSIVYLVFGLALTSMCINVVQVMLSDSFKHATQKIGATIGFEIVEENSDGVQLDRPASTGEVAAAADVHATITEEDENNDSTNKQSNNAISIKEQIK